MLAELHQGFNKFDVLIVIDTTHIKATYQAPSQDKTQPTLINPKDLFLIVSGADIIENSEDSLELKLSAKRGTNVSFRATSIYANADDAVIVYGISPENSVFELFQPNFVTINRVLPNPKSPDRDGLHPNYKSITSVSYEAKVRGAGTEQIHVYIALYNLNNNDRQTQKLLGYFSCKLAITLELLN